jgi:hypothetical protein
MKARILLAGAICRTLTLLILILAADRAVASDALAQAPAEPQESATTGEHPSAVESGMPSMPMEGMKSGRGGMSSMPMKEGMKMSCTCESAMMGIMQGPLGIALIALSVLLLASVVGALAALSIFLIRRSRYPGRDAVA